MQKARIEFKKKTILDDGLVIHQSENLDESDEEKIYFAFFDDSEVALYSNKSKFIAKIRTDELEQLIEKGSIKVLP